MKRIIIISLLTGLFVSCNKNEDQNCNFDMASVAGTWRITAVKYKASASSAEVDYYNQFFPNACERDDRVTLNANGTYVFTDAGVVCTPPGDDTGTWSTNGNNLVVDGGSSPVENYNCSTITVVNSDVQVAGDRMTLVLTRL